MVGANNFFCLLMFLHFRILISEKQSFSKKKLPFRTQKESQVDFTSWGAWKRLNKPTQVSVSVDTKIQENNVAI